MTQHGIICSLMSAKKRFRTCLQTSVLGLQHNLCEFLGKYAIILLIDYIIVPIMSFEKFVTSIKFIYYPRRLSGVECQVGMGLTEKVF